ncbi:hypothetical protein ANS015_30360 [Paraclostridium bifermentans]|nr:hypothetical protein ANS015_30360 [Paraclostridium bifermentans]
MIFSSTSFTTLIRSILHLPHVGQDITFILSFSKSKLLSISLPTITSSVGSPVRDILIVSPIPFNKRAPTPIEDFIVPFFTLPDSVIPI